MQFIKIIVYKVYKVYIAVYKVFLFLLYPATKLAKRAAARLNVDAVGNDTAGVPFTSESSAAKEASALFSLYYGGKLLMPRLLEGRFCNNSEIYRH